MCFRLKQPRLQWANCLHWSTPWALALSLTPSWAILQETSAVALKCAAPHRKSPLWLPAGKTASKLDKTWEGVGGSNLAILASIASAAASGSKASESLLSQTHAGTGLMHVSKSYTKDSKSGSAPGKACSQPGRSVMGTSSSLQSAGSHFGSTSSLQARPGTVTVTHAKLVSDAVSAAFKTQQQVYSSAQSVRSSQVVNPRPVSSGQNTKTGPSSVLQSHSHLSAISCFAATVKSTTSSGQSTASRPLSLPVKSRPSQPGSSSGRTMRSPTLIPGIRPLLDTDPLHCGGGVKQAWSAYEQQRPSVAKASTSLAAVTMTRPTISQRGSVAVVDDSDSDCIVLDEWYTDCPSEVVSSLWLAISRCIVWVFYYSACTASCVQTLEVYVYQP